MWKKIVASTILLSLFWVFVHVVIGRYLDWNDQSAERLLSYNVARMTAAADIEEKAWLIHAKVAVARTDGQRPVDSDLSEPENACRAAFAVLEQGLLSPDEAARVRAIRDSSDNYLRFAKAELRAAAAETPSELSVLRQSRRQAMAIAEQCRALRTVNQAAVIKFLEEHRRWTLPISAARMFLLLSGPILGVLLGVWCMSSLRKSIRRVSIQLAENATSAETDHWTIDLSPSSSFEQLESQIAYVTAHLSRVIGDLEAERRNSIRAERLAAIGELASSAAHELRNPLTSIKLIVQTAAKKSRDKPLSDKQFQILQDEILRMEEAIQWLMELGRPSRPRFMALDLCEPARRAVNLIRTLAARNEIRLTVEIPSAPINVLGDSGQLQQVFLSLLLKGMETTPSGKALTMVVDETAIPDHPHVARIVVSDSDHNNGATSSDLSMLKSSDPDARMGTGLYFSQLIVKEHSGAISSQVYPDGATRSVVEFPCVTADEAREKMSKPQGPSADLPTIPS